MGSHHLTKSQPTSSDVHVPSPPQGQTGAAAPLAPKINPKAKKKILSNMGPDVNNLEATILKEALEPTWKEASAVIVSKGGPGSGVGYDNTAPFKLPQSPHVSVGTRGALLENMDYTNDEIPMDKITHVGQSKYVPFKLTRIMKDYDKVMQTPISVLKVKDEYHVVDGHHRFLAAKINGESVIKAKVYEKAARTFDDYEEPEDVEKGGPGSGPQGGGGQGGSSGAEVVSISDHQPPGQNDGSGPKSGGKIPAGQEHLFNGTKIHESNHTRDSATTKAKEMRSSGTYASIHHVGGPRTGPKSNYLVSVGKSSVSKATPDAATASDSDPRVAQSTHTPNDLLLAIEALGYSWADAPSSGAGNRQYASQGGLVRKEDVTEPAEDLVDEHEELVDVLENGDDAELSEEAAKQKKELAGYKKRVAKSILSILVPIHKSDSAKQIVYGVVLTPDEEDLQGDIITAEEIEKTAHNYMAKSRVVGSNHKSQMKAHVVESFIAPDVMNFEDGPYGKQVVNKGAWVLGVKITDPKEWKKVESGEYSGFSVGGMGLRDKLN